jgi:hypothetical protein
MNPHFSRTDPVCMGDPDGVDHGMYFPAPMIQKCVEPRKFGRAVDRLEREGLQKGWTVRTPVKDFRGEQAAALDARREI